MLLEDYGKIIIKGLCNSPHHLKEYFSREIKNLADKHYLANEVTDKLLQVVSMYKQKIHELYEDEKRYHDENFVKDKSLPQPILENINLTKYKFPSGNSLVFPTGRKYSLKDFEEIEKVLKLNFQQSETKTEQETPTFTNNFDNITPTEIYNHFKAGLVEKGYLTEQELNEYLKAAFELKTIPGTLFKIKDAPTKQKVMKVFYEYYKNIAGKPHKKQSQYAALLGDYFEGYNTQNVSTNFNK